MTEALKQTAAPGVPPAKGSAKHGRKADPAGFGEALRQAGQPRGRASREAATTNEIVTPPWRKADKIETADGRVVAVDPLKAAAVLTKHSRVMPSKDELQPDQDDESTDIIEVAETTGETDEDDTAPLVAVDVMVQFSAALQVLRQGGAEEQQPVTARTDPIAKADDAKPAAGSETKGAAKTAGPAIVVEAAIKATADVPAPSPTGAPSAAVRIEGVTVVVAQTQAAVVAPIAERTLTRTFAPASTDEKPKAAVAEGPAPDSELPVKVTPMAQGGAADGQSRDDNPDPDRKSANATPDVKRVEPATAQPRIAVEAAATSATQASTNANAVISAISSAAPARSTAETVAEMLLRMSSPTGNQVQTLKVQLHPAELGVVTAHLRFADEQLSVELQAENADAYHRLSLDAESIAKSLRALGFDVDQVTVQQPQTMVASSARVDLGGNSAGGFPRDGASFQSGNSANGERRTGGQTAGRGREDNGGHTETTASIRQNSTGGGIYI